MSRIRRTLTVAAAMAFSGLAATPAQAADAPLPKKCAEVDNMTWVCVEQTERGNLHAWAVADPNVYETTEVILWIGNQRQEQYYNRTTSEHDVHTWSSTQSLENVVAVVNGKRKDNGRWDRPAALQYT
ncbi:hypothetical protein [Streptomyces sp. NPDC000410]|uniref:hypothetical protein n=1 Tax=Streptomyces sp. NPDC000410 TaxID=3154254 RepID=UPI0033228E51